MDVGLGGPTRPSTSTLLLSHPCFFLFSQRVLLLIAQIQKPFGGAGAVLPPIQACVRAVPDQHRALAEEARPVCIQKVRRTITGGWGSSTCRPVLLRMSVELNEGYGIQVWVLELLSELAYRSYAPPPPPPVGCVSLLERRGRCSEALENAGKHRSLTVGITQIPHRTSSRDVVTCVHLTRFEDSSLCVCASASCSQSRPVSS